MKNFTKTLCCLVTALSLTGCNKANEEGKVIDKQIVPGYLNTTWLPTSIENMWFPLQEYVPTTYRVYVERCDKNKRCDGVIEIPVSQESFEKAKIGEYLNLKK